MNNGQFSLEVVVNGRPMHEYDLHGLSLVEGKRGFEYTLRVKNGSARNVLAVISVDGLSVITGKLTSSRDTGYVLGPEEVLEVPGWRLNNQAVAHFLFDELPKSYANLMGKPDNIGVIGAVFYYQRPVIRHSSRGLIPTRGDTLKGVGTGFGRQTEHPVQYVHFEPEDRLAAILIIRYDDAQGLRDRGITLIPEVTEDRVLNANPFPGDEPGCKPPAGWQG